MCSTCDYKTYGVVDGKYEQTLNGNLVIKCDGNGQSYKLGVKNEPKSFYVIYRCPTCGRKLY